MNPSSFRRTVIVSLVICGQALASGARAASVDVKKAVDAWVAAFNSHDLHKVEAIYEPKAVVVSVKPSGLVEERGTEPVRKALEPYFTAFPDVRLAPKRIFRKGETVIVEWVAVGTNTGSFAGAPPSGKRAGISGVSVLTFDDKGLVKRSETVFDEATLAQQVGLAPGPARAVPTLPTAAAAWLDAGAAAAQTKTVAAAKATWPENWTKHDRAGYDASVTDDGLHVELAGPNEFKGRAAVLAEYDMYAKAIPDMQVKITDAWAFGDTAVLKFVFSGTMKGAIGPFKPTNKAIVIHGIDVDDLRGGKMATAVTYSNGVELLTELGAFPPPKH